MEEMNEEWRPIPGYEGLYEISNLRRVRSVARTEQIGNSQRPRASTLIRLDHGRATLSRGGKANRVNANRIADEIFADSPIEQISEPGEAWKPVPGFEDFYELSNRGRVRTKARKITDGRYRKARMLKLSTVNGYLVVHLCPVGRVGEKLYVERAVFELFPETREAPPDLPGEEWKDIRGYEGFYRVSNFGRILSLDRLTRKRRFIRSRVREHGSDGGGYPKVELARDGRIETALIHRLVADAFVPNPLNLPVVHHRDENRLNSRADNLEWVTNKANVQDWFDRRRVVISADTIEAIAAAVAAGKTPDEILATLPRKRKSKT